MTNLARFTIQGTASTTGGYDVAISTGVAFALENPSNIVQRWTLQVYSASEPDAPRCSKAAPTLTLVGATSGQKVDAATPASVIATTTPGAAGHSWIVRSLVNGGLNAQGLPDPDYVFERILAIRTATGLRKIVATEATQYAPGGWADAVNEFLDTILGGGLADGSVTNVKVATGAAIDVSKLAPGAANTTLTSNGVTAAWTSAASAGVPRVTAVPTLGHWQTGELLLWGADATRLALRAQRTGALGTVARANSTAYSANAILSSGTRLFVVAIAGTTAGSAPGALATAAFGDRIVDGQATLECVGTTVQTPDFVSIPNLDAPAVALANSNATIQITDGPVRECATATANRTTLLGTTGAMQGDVWTFRRMGNEAFSWLFDGTAGGGDSVLIPASSRAVVRFVMSPAGLWVLRDATGALA